MSKLRLRETWPGILLILVGVIGLIYNGITSISAPKVMNETDIPEEVERIYARFDNLELIGYGYTDKRYVPNEKVSVTLYWRMIEPTDEDLTLSLALINPYGDVINYENDPLYPDEILLETSIWEPGLVYALNYKLLLKRHSTRVPHIFSLAVNLYDVDINSQIDAIGETGASIDVVLDIGAVSSHNIRAPQRGLQILSPNIGSLTFGNTLRVEGFGYTIFEEELTFDVEVLWESQTDIDTDYITFMHIYDADYNLVSQYDFQPQLPTRYWRNNEDFRLTYSVYPPENGFSPGIYSVNFGWYELRYDNTTGLYTSINLLIESEISTYEIFEFEVDEEGVILLPALDIEN